VVCTDGSTGNHFDSRPVQHFCVAFGAGAYDERIGINDIFVRNEFAIDITDVGIRLKDSFQKRNVFVCYNINHLITILSMYFVKLLFLMNKSSLWR
jgi:hypothetical protein